VLDASLHGRAAPKTKTINVEANLLAERIAERERLREAIIKRIAAIATIVVVAGVSLPFLWKTQAGFAVQAAVAQKMEKGLQTKLAAIQQKQSTAEPVLANQAMAKKVHAQAESFLGQVTLFFNGASENMALTDVKAEVVAGELKISAKAEAENYTVAHEFVGSNSEGPKVKEVILISVRRSGQLAAEGVTLDMVKKVGL
jgi:hypothetical protein